MKTLLFFSIVLLIFSTGCDSAKEKSLVSAEARQQITKLYGCRVIPTLKPDTSPQEGRNTYLELLLREGKALAFPSMEHVAANASLIAYRDLAPAERKKLTHIRCLIEEEGKKIPFRHDIGELQAIAAWHPKVKQIDSLLLAGQYEALPALMTTYAQEELGTSLIRALQTQEQEKGKITESKSLGFKVGQSRLDGEVFDAVSWMFLIKRSGKNTYLELVFPLNAEEKRVLGIRTFKE